MNYKRCNHDGGKCHHYCESGDCFRLRTCVPLTEPWDGYPKTGEYEAKVETVRTVSVEYSGAIFGRPAEALAWARKIRQKMEKDGIDPAAIRVKVYKAPK